MAKKSKKNNNKSRPRPTDTDNFKKIKIRVIGIGGGGGNIVSEIASKISKASFVAANTDIKSLKGCGRNVIKFQFGQNLTHGLGTGMDPELARKAAKNEKEKIKKLCQGQDLCILVACLGGGTASGAAATFAKISKELGNLTYGIFTLPFKFEGEKKIEVSINALKEIKSNLNAMTIIPNERVFQIINKDTPLKEALSVINQFLSEGLSGLIETIYQPGLINIDFADFRTILEGRGMLTYLNSIEVEKKEGDIKDMASKALNSSLYPYTIQGAKGILFNIVGEKNLPLFDVEQISSGISGLVNPEAKIIFGISQNSKRSNSVKIVLLATGCRMKMFSEKIKKEKKAAVEPKTEENKPVAEKKEPSKVKRKKTIISKDKKQDKKEEKERKNGLQVKEEIEEAEKEIIEKERIWETPAFLRKK